MPARASASDSASSLTLFLDSRMSMPLGASRPWGLRGGLTTKPLRGTTQKARRAFWKLVPYKSPSQTFAWINERMTSIFAKSNKHFRKGPHIKLQLISVFISTCTFQKGRQDLSNTHRLCHHNTGWPLPRGHGHKSP